MDNSPKKAQSITKQVHKKTNSSVSSLEYIGQEQDIPKHLPRKPSKSSLNMPGFS